MWFMATYMFCASAGGDRVYGLCRLTKWLRTAQWAGSIANPGVLRTDSFDRLGVILPAEDN